MPRVIFIYPCIGRKPGQPQVRSWQMQPLAIAQLAALTPPAWERVFYDDRMEPVPSNAAADLCAISIETYSARRGYQLAAAFRQRGVPVVFGGYHASACPDEALRHGDAVCIGEAEGVWPRMLEDAAAGRLRGIYQSPQARDFPRGQPDRSIFAGKRYLPIQLLETGRGCPHHCEFCAITAFHGGSYRRRNVDDIVEELRGMRGRTVFFVDDNITAERRGLRELCEKITPLKVSWISQASIDVARDEELPHLLARAGCTGLLIGFESLDPARLQAMHKHTNQADDYAAAVSRLHRAGIAIYGTFVFGYPGDTAATFDAAVAFARRQRMFLAAFNHLVPFPGTELHATATSDGRLPVSAWWLDPEFRFGQTPLHTSPMEPRALVEACVRARRQFYSWPGIAARFANLRANGRSTRRAVMFWTLNAMLRREVAAKSGIPLGLPDASAEDLP
ncbi:MAG: radical SAM protein [Verrucomicrobia bacterium]|nr:radical SAM protein [Verrucomicrobiota bacterium]